jgi:hypothetical protein
MKRSPTSRDRPSGVALDHVEVDGMEGVVATG